MRILGVDPGLNVCGYAVLYTQNDRLKILEAGTVKTDEKQDIQTRLNQISADFVSLLDRFDPDCMAVEDLYSHYAHPRTAILMGHARGVILQKAGEKGIEVNTFSATKIKKAVSGNGRASKHQIQLSIQTAFNLPQAPSPPDVADAIAAAICCFNSMDDRYEK